MWIKIDEKNENRYNYLKQRKRMITVYKLAVNSKKECMYINGTENVEFMRTGEKQNGEYQKTDAVSFYNKCGNIRSLSSEPGIFLCT